MDALETMATRRSHSKLSMPAPDDEQLQKMLEIAMTAPDHKTLRPWKFIVVRNDSRMELGEVMRTAMSIRDPGASAGKLEKESAKPLRAPVVVAVAATQVETKLPFIELITSTAAATQNLLLAAHGLGYSAIWRTGAAVYDESVKRWFGLRPVDELVGLVYIGTSVSPPGPRPAVPAGSIEWRG